MEKIFIFLFVLVAVPYIGLPSMYDTPIYVVATAGLVYFSYLFLKKHVEEVNNSQNTNNGELNNTKKTSDK